tara:strand:+ start:127 stop:690 length:564 start_codon:yes stop_codon:yes gene_type:complete
LKRLLTTLIATLVTSIALAFIWLCIQRPPEEFTASQLEIRLPGRHDESPILGISLPESMEYEKNAGVDFIVHYLRFRKNTSAIGIYTGNHPSRFIEAADDSVWKIIGGREIEWKIGRSDGRLMAETVLEMFLNPGPDYRGEIFINRNRVHIFVELTNRRDLERLITFCQTLRLVRPSIPLRDRKNRS